jgi:hypothetical protein
LAVRVAALLHGQSASGAEMSIDDFETFYRRDGEHRIAVGIVPRTEQATREQVAKWDRC